MQAWLNFLNHTASYLNNVGSLYSWHMMNEPALGDWACNVSIPDFVQLWTEMRNIFKSLSDRPVSIRFSPYIFDTHFHCDQDIYGICDYISLNWYEDQNYTKEDLAELIPEIQRYKPVMISEFGYNKTTGNPTIGEEYQVGNFTDHINLFKNAGVHDAIAWMWRADNNNTSNPERPGENYNLAKNWDGTPKKAFYILRDNVPPLLAIESPENGACYATNASFLSFTVSEQPVWIGYSLDGQLNATIVGNTTLLGLSDDYHSLTIFANDTAGNMGASNTTFIVDTIPPNITQIVQTPIALVLPEDEVRIDSAIYDANGVKCARLSYTIDNETWRTVEMTSGGKEMWNATIPALPYGTNVTYRIEAQDIASNNITSDESGYTFGYTVIPEFPTVLILPMLVVATSVCVLFMKKKRHSAKLENRLAKSKPWD